MKVNFQSYKTEENTQEAKTKQQSLLNPSEIAGQMDPPSQTPVYWIRVDDQIRLPKQLLGSPILKELEQDKKKLGTLKIHFNINWILFENSKGISESPMPQTATL